MKKPGSSIFIICFWGSILAPSCQEKKYSIQNPPVGQISSFSYSHTAPWEAITWEMEGETNNNGVEAVSELKSTHVFNQGTSEKWPFHLVYNNMVWCLF